MGIRVGVDAGGTFVDVALIDEDTGDLDVWKAPSMPDDPSRAIFRAVSEALSRSGRSLADVTFLGHGTTVATNALIEHKGTRTGLIISRGFRDLLEIGRQKRPSLYDMMADKPAILVERRLRREVPERLRADGSCETPLDLAAVEQAAAALNSAEVGAVAICFLYSFLDPAHERAARDAVCRINANLFISVSHETAPEFREYERLSTTVINAYLGPVMQRYIARLTKRLACGGLARPPVMTQSNGGVVSFSTAAEFPVRTLLSGPSTGVVAAQEVARSAGHGNVITFDAGGTSSDVALLADGICRRTGEGEIQGYPVKAQMLEIHSVGAGGGSIASVDSGGLLKVGPESAGAEPGPVCYGLGGDRPTVTDANIVLGILSPSNLLGGRMQLQRGLAAAAIDRIAAGIGLGREDTAQGIIAVATANMARAIRVISVQRGYDPRDFALCAFGGSGPLHAVRLARELEIGTVIIPSQPGILCAMGLLLTDLKTDFARSRISLLDDLTPDALQAGLNGLEADAAGWFDKESIAADRRLVNRSADLRYRGQNYELPVTVPAGEVSVSTIADLRQRFGEAHRQRYGFAADDDPVELVTLRVEATGLVDKPDPAIRACAAEGPAELVSSREVWLPEAGGAVRCPVFARGNLPAGHRLGGPAILEQMDTTTLLPPGSDARVDRSGNLIVSVK